MHKEHQKIKFPDNPGKNSFVDEPKNRPLPIYNLISLLSKIVVIYLVFLSQLNRSCLLLRVTLMESRTVDKFLNVYPMVRRSS